MSEATLSKRKGRQRIPGPREPNGRAQRVRDTGTDQLQARREWLAGEGDMTKTTYPLGILLANGQITEDEHTSGCRLAWLYAVVYGKVSVGAAAFEGGRGKSIREIDEDREINLQNEAAAMLNTLSAISRHVRDDVVSLVVYERIPGFMRPGFQTHSDVRHSKRIKDGLAALAVGKIRLRKAG